MTAREILRMGEEVLVQADVPEAKINAWYLFAYCFGETDETGQRRPMERGAFFLREGEEMREESLAEYKGLLARRAERIPLEYLIHETEFMGLPFFVNEHVLIPRQDTECLVEEVLQVSNGKDVLDLCCGSGCIGVSLAVLGQCQSVTMADISREALRVARRNAVKNHAAADTVQSDLFSGLEGKFDIIVSNPPYIPTDEIDELMPEVRDYEPRLALDGAGDGLFFYRSIIKESRYFLEKGGVLCFEIGCSQAESVAALMEQAGFTGVTVKKDLAGLDRIVRGTWDEKEHRTGKTDR